MADEDRRPTRQERRAAQRAAEGPPPPAPSVVSVRVGACYQAHAAATRKRLHDDLIASHPVRSGPVEWAEFPTHDQRELRRILRLAHHEDDGELMRFILMNPGCILIVAMVPVPIATGGRA